MPAPLTAAGLNEFVRRCTLTRRAPAQAYRDALDTALPAVRALEAPDAQGHVPRANRRLAAQFWQTAIWLGVYEHLGQSLDDFLALHQPSGLLALHPSIIHIKRVAEAWGPDFWHQLRRRRIRLLAVPPKNLFEQLHKAAGRSTSLAAFARSLSSWLPKYYARPTTFRRRRWAEQLSRGTYTLQHAALFQYLDEVQPGLCEHVAGADASEAPTVERPRAGEDAPLDYNDAALTLDDASLDADDASLNFDDAPPSFSADPSLNADDDASLNFDDAAPTFNADDTSLNADDASLNADDAAPTFNADASLNADDAPPSFSADPSLNADAPPSFSFSPIAADLSMTPQVPSTTRRLRSGSETPTPFRRPSPLRQLPTPRKAPRTSSGRIQKTSAPSKSWLDRELISGTMGDAALDQLKQAHDALKLVRDNIKAARDTSKAYAQEAKIAHASLEAATGAELQLRQDIGHGLKNIAKDMDWHGLPSVKDLGDARSKKDQRVKSLEQFLINVEVARAGVHSGVSLDEASLAQFYTFTVDKSAIDRDIALCHTQSKTLDEHREKLIAAKHCQQKSEEKALMAKEKAVKYQKGADAYEKAFEQMVCADHEMMEDDEEEEEEEVDVEMEV
ncbi:hypothetical protein BDU57DRAFT_525085 [Ampelomyces quisqualis]|uniref:Uncharacterized protein n=1 Tax=Ampelomyces quisqualis TaxID=50730 RepID=A0A6A5Q9I0_AMPQU|nr:hypothetical protein BDU57DRAFT_525085 [Ampelomyces quisqualis]